MGMFDYINCEAPLPGDPPAWSGLFQTKDLDCQMDTYTISREGKLIGVENFTGSIDFYNSNIVASGPGIYTANGEDAESAGYRAVFLHGLLVGEIIETSRERQPAAKRKPVQYEAPTPEEVESAEGERSANFIGRDLFVQWGGDTEGYFAKVVYENEESLVMERNGHGRHELEIIDRYQIGNCLFETKEQSVEHSVERMSDWERRKREYEQEIANR